MAKRIFFGSSSLAVRPTTFNTSGTPTTGSWVRPLGIQSVGFSTSVAFEPMFQLGQTELYGRTESQSPEIEATISKGFDGTELLYITLMGGNSVAGSKQPAELLMNNSELELAIFSESVPYASGTPESVVYCSGMYISNVSLNFPLDGMATEEITLVGDTKFWRSAQMSSESYGSNKETKIGEASAHAPYQRWSLDKEDANCVLPSGIDGYPIQSISVSMGMGRESIQELGTRGKYCRYATFPFEVTTEFEVIAGKRPATFNAASADLEVGGYDFFNDFDYACSSDAKYNIDRVVGDDDDATGTDPSDGNIEAGYIDAGFRDQPIKLKFCGATASDSLIIDLGTKCRTTSVNYSGGDTGGENVTLSYSFQSYNEFKITGSGHFASTTGPS